MRKPKLWIPAPPRWLFLMLMGWATTALVIKITEAFYR